MLKGTLLRWLLLLLAVLLLPLPAFALSQLTLSSPNADGVFVVTAANLDGVHGVDLQIGYDSSTLTNPRIEMGSVASGTINAANRGNPVRIMLIASKALTGSGTVATITFDRSGSSPGNITNFSASLSDLYGRKVPAQSLLVPVQLAASGSNSNQNGDGQSTTQSGSSQTSSSQTSSSQTTPATETSGSTGRRYLVGGKLRMAQDEEPDIPSKKEESPYAVPESEDQQNQEPTPTPAAPAPVAPGRNGQTMPAQSEAQPPAQPQKIVPVLERFRQFQGGKTLPALVDLFKSGTAAFQQYPPIAVSDGQSTVRIVIPKAAAGDKTPNFTFHSAKFVSVAPAGDGGWEVEVRPERGTVDASVAMLTDAGPQEYPLTVTPRPDVLAGKSAEALESEFPTYLKEQGTPSAPKYDLNGDGKRDYIDDYIYTANYLLKLQEREKQPAPPPPKQ